MMHVTNRRLWIVVAAVGLVACQRAERPFESRAPAAVAYASQDLNHGDRFATDAVLQNAVKLLLAQQSSDGAWRSDFYGSFKEGDALTAQVLAAWLAIGPLGDRARYDTAVARAREYLSAMVDDRGRIRSPQHGLAYPIYTAAGAVIALASSSDERHVLARDAWTTYLRQRQLTEALGWSEADREFGGWGYAAEPAPKPAAGQPLGDLATPNLSATVFALEALQAAGASSSDPAISKARRFVERCQNVALDSAQRDPAFDDGGFVFVLDDPVRNKAGVRGVDRLGRQRFASYGSATADGLRALLLCGATADDPRVVAAWQWLERHFTADNHPGDYADDQQAAKRSVYFYYCHSLAAVLAADHSSNPAAAARRQRWAHEIISALARQQQPDGSWRNTAVDVREDDPLVATPLAALAIVRCRAALAGSSAVP